MPGVVSIPVALALGAVLQNPATQSQDSVPATAHAGAPRIAAARLHGEVTIDGDLDEPAWTTAEPASQFRQTDPDEGRPETERTEVRVLIGDDALYLGAPGQRRDNRQRAARS